MRFHDIPQFPKSVYEVDVSWSQLENHIADQIGYADCPLDLDPDFQRAHVWTEDQQRAYVEYILKGGEVGRNLIFNCPGWMRSFAGPYQIVDGKQRLEAARKFLRGDLAIFGGHRFGGFRGAPQDSHYFPMESLLSQD